MKIGKLALYVIGILAILLIVVELFAVRMVNKFMFSEKTEHLRYTLDSMRIEFQWSEGTYGSYKEPHDAIRIPIQIEGTSQKFHFQFDTGSPTSMLYGNPLNSIRHLLSNSNEIIIDNALSD